jgi:hypothetical protein
MRLALFGIVALALVAAALWYGMRPRVYRNISLKELRRFVSSLLAQMAPGGFFVAERQGGAGFLQLALRTATPDFYTVEFGLPEIDWSAPHFEAVRAALERNAFEDTIEEGAGEVSRFMRVVITGTAEQVGDRAVTLFKSVAESMGWGTSSTFAVRFGGPLDLPRIRAQLAAARGRGA